MPARANVLPYAYLDYQIDELSLGAATNKYGAALELAVYAYGEAVIAYDRAGDWEIVALRLDGSRRIAGRSAWLKEAAELTNASSLYPIIITALHDLSAEDIDDRVADELAKERQAA